MPPFEAFDVIVLATAVFMGNLATLSFLQGAKRLAKDDYGLKALAFYCTPPAFIVAVLMVTGS
jgi:hypothetical protein